MSQNTKQGYINRSMDGGSDTKYDQTAVSAAAAAALQQSLALSPSQLHFMQAAAAAAASPQSMQLSLPWMLPQYQMMVLPEGMQQSLMGGQSLVQLPDGRVILAPISEDGSIGQTMSSEDVATAEALLRQQLQRQALAATTNSVQQQQQQQQLLYQQQLQQHQLQQQQLQQQQLSAASMSQQQAQQSAAKIQSADNSRADLPPQPKKPLTPYMMFSKAIWPQVKAANTHLSSVCEIGAVIGSLWRDLDVTEKQKYNEQFAREKERYDNELRAYLKSTGLHASDLVKAKVKRKDVRSSSINSVPHLNPAIASVGNTGTIQRSLANPSSQGTTTIPFSSPSIVQRLNMPATFTSGQQLIEAGLSGQSHDSTQQVSRDKVDVPSQMWQINPNDVGSQQAALQAQVVQLREALSEKTNEVLRLNQSLDAAQKMIEIYKAQLASIDASNYPSNTIINNVHTTAGNCSSGETISDNGGNILHNSSGYLLPDGIENESGTCDDQTEIKALDDSMKNSSNSELENTVMGPSDGEKHVEGPASNVENGETKTPDYDVNTHLENEVKEEDKNLDSSANDNGTKLNELSDGSELPKSVLQDDS